MKNYLLAAACCLPLSLLAQTGFTILGKSGNLDAPSKAVLVHVDNGQRVVDSTVLHHGTFSFSGRVTDPGLALLYILPDPSTPTTIDMGGDPRQRFDIPYLTFYLENSNIAITVKDSLGNATVEGSATDADSKTLLASLQPYQAMQDAMSAAYMACPPAARKDTAWLASLKPMAQAIIHGRDSAKRAFIRTHPNSYLSLLLFKEVELPYNFNPDTAAAAFAQLPESQRATAFGQKLQAMIDNIKKTGIGRTAADFTEPDTAGRPISLSDFRGHYVLLDFWASWCAPCREENPNYLKAYNNYKDKNFTILGVSLDDQKGKSAWLKAVRDDNLPWTQVSELKGFAAKAALDYVVQAIPTNFLIDPSGKIIAKNLRGEALGKKLSEIFSR